MQYTIRGVPKALDFVLRERARAMGKSLNEAAIDALTVGAGLTGKTRKRRSLNDIAGTWKPDRAVESAISEQDQVEGTPEVRALDTT